jgi:peptidoglycan/LPS O-acetylase OafA/YrhL
MAPPVFAALPVKADLERASVQQGEYRPDIDGLRAVAVLAVVGFHAAPKLVPGGFVGVDVFFVISGFLISGIIFRSMTQRTFRCFEFYVRRVKRIFPALIVMMAAVWALAWLVFLSDEYQLLGKHIAAAASFVLNLILYRDFNWYFFSNTPLLHLWSLGVEEQFYLLWPAFLIAVWKFERSRLGVLAAITAISFALNVSTISSNQLGSFYLPSSRLWELSLGSALAYVKLNRICAIDKCAALVAKPLSWLRVPAYQLPSAGGAVLLVASFFFSTMVFHSLAGGH